MKKILFYALLLFLGISCEKTDFATDPEGRHLIRSIKVEKIVLGGIKYEDEYIFRYDDQNRLSYYTTTQTMVSAKYTDNQVEIITSDDENKKSYSTYTLRDGLAIKCVSKPFEQEEQVSYYSYSRNYLKTISFANNVSNTEYVWGNDNITEMKFDYIPNLRPEYNGYRVTGTLKVAYGSSSPLNNANIDLASFICFGDDFMAKCMGIMGQRTKQIPSQHEIGYFGGSNDTSGIFKFETDKYGRVTKIINMVGEDIMGTYTITYQ